VVAPRRGDVWWGEVPDQKPRPFLVLTRDEAIHVLSRIVVAPVTRTVRGIPSEVSLGPEEGLSVECVASFDNVMTLSKAMLIRRLGALAPSRRPEACEAMRSATDC
jgi:mRNA interferase MazF